MTFPAESSQVLGCLCLLLFVEKYKGGVGEGAAVTGSAGALRSSQSSNRAVNPTPQIKINQLASLDQERGPRPSREEEPLSPSLPRCPWGRPGSSGETCEAAVAPWTQPALPLPLLWKFLPEVPAPLVHGPPPARCRRPAPRFPGEVSPPVSRSPRPPPRASSALAVLAARCPLLHRLPRSRPPRSRLGLGGSGRNFPPRPAREWTRVRKVARFPSASRTQVHPGLSGTVRSPLGQRAGAQPLPVSRGPPSPRPPHLQLPSRLPGSSLPETSAPAARTAAALEALSTRPSAQYRKSRDPAPFEGPPPRRRDHRSAQWGALLSPRPRALAHPPVKAPAGRALLRTTAVNSNAARHRHRRLLPNKSLRVWPLPVCTSCPQLHGALIGWMPGFCPGHRCSPATAWASGFRAPIPTPRPSPKF